MPVSFGTLPNVIREVEGGTLRVGNSRVSLDSVVHAFNRGDDAVEIQDAFDSLSLAEVYGAISYYLHNREKVDTYLAKRAAEFEREREESHKDPNFIALRKKLLARRGKPREEWDK